MQKLLIGVSALASGATLLLSLTIYIQAMQGTADSAFAGNASPSYQWLAEEAAVSEAANPASDNRPADSEKADGFDASAFLASLENASPAAPTGASVLPAVLGGPELHHSANHFPLPDEPRSEESRSNLRGAPLPPAIPDRGARLHPTATQSASFVPQADVLALSTNDIAMAQHRRTSGAPEIRERKEQKPARARGARLRSRPRSASILDPDADDSSHVEGLPAHHATEYRVTNTLMEHALLPRTKPVAVEPPAPQGEEALVTMEKPFTFKVNARLEYEFIEYGGDIESESDRIGAVLAGGVSTDKWVVDFAVPIDSARFEEGFPDSDYTRMGVMATPRFYFMREDAGIADLSGGMSLFHFRTTGDDNIETLSQTGLGLVAAARKTFGPAVFSLAGTWEHSFDENEVGAMESGLDAFSLGANVGVPIGEKLALNGWLVYNSLLGLNLGDAEWVTLGLGGSFALNEKMVLDLNLESDMGYEDTQRYTGGLDFAFKF